MPLPELRCELTGGKNQSDFLLHYEGVTYKGSTASRCDTMIHLVTYGLSDAAEAHQNALHILIPPSCKERTPSLQCRRSDTELLLMRIRGAQEKLALNASGESSISKEASGNRLGRRVGGLSRKNVAE